MHWCCRRIPESKTTHLNVGLAGLWWRKYWSLVEFWPWAAHWWWQCPLVLSSSCSSKPTQIFLSLCLRRGNADIWHTFGSLVPTFIKDVPLWGHSSNNFLNKCLFHIFYRLSPIIRESVTIWTNDFLKESEHCITSLYQQLQKMCSYWHAFILMLMPKNQSEANRNIIFKKINVKKYTCEICSCVRDWGLKYKTEMVHDFTECS